MVFRASQLRFIPEALDEMDFECGDADCGGTHRDAAEALLATLEVGPGRSKSSAERCRRGCPDPFCGRDVIGHFSRVLEEGA